MDADIAKRIATEKLPCTCSRLLTVGHEEDEPDHGYRCPAHYRPVIAEALLEAARMPTEAELTETIYNAMVDGRFEGRVTMALQCAQDAARAILAEWSKPQADSTGEGR